MAEKKKVVKKEVKKGAMTVAEMKAFQQKGYKKHLGFKNPVSK